MSEVVVTGFPCPLFHCLLDHTVNACILLIFSRALKGWERKKEVPFIHHPTHSVPTFCHELQSVSEVVGTAILPSPVLYFNVKSHNERAYSFIFFNNTERWKEGNHDICAIKHTVFQLFVINCSSNSQKGIANKIAMMQCQEIRLDTHQCNSHHSQNIPDDRRSNTTPRCYNMSHWPDIDSGCLHTR